jgi:N-acetylmuramoyl-L-alanine amidase
MIAGLALFLQTAVAVPPALIVRQAETVRTVPAIPTLSGTYLRADLLATALGGTSGEAPQGRYRMTLGESNIEMEEGVPFLRVGSAVVPLLLPPLRSGRTFLLPFQVATSVIPRFATGFNYDLAALELRIFNTAARRVVETPPQPSPNTVTTLPSITNSTPRPRRTQRRLIVVDAGHGGPDPGMRGPIGSGPRIVEKNVTLAVARLLAQELRSSGVDVLMTRTTDTLIALSDRGPLRVRARQRHWLTQLFGRA